MARRIEEFDEKILLCAKKEFLEKGYTEASIRTIAQNAGVSTSTIYTRYSDKEGLFRFLVEPAAKGLIELLRQLLSDFSSLKGHEQEKKFMEHSDHGFEAVIAYIYKYFPEFRLLITGAPGNYYQDFLEELVELDTSCTKKFLIQTGSKAMAEGRVTDGFLHVVSSAFYAGIFEVVIHDMPMEEAKKYIKELRIFYGNGWKEYYQK
ncbi:TetR/AcrR family transcriptional regulator [Pseudoramibacter faecis]|uniref:TetR/AcrR family transcriptional regulator n=1 Tax=Pseudoramibacter faecis TaxID=3108534 RepID=UPI002E787859|nr:TetR/AcrR family transcriptional regulator [Pseudoramibacter sp. HA2172]